MNERYTPETRDQIYRGTVEETFDAPLILNGQYGKIGCAADNGLESKGMTEDVVAIDMPHNAFAVIDGMGGMGNAKQAADILAAELLSAFGRTGGKRREDFTQSIQSQALIAALRMRDAGAGGACFIAARIVAGSLQYCQAGDVRAILMDTRKRELVGWSDDEGNEDQVFNAVTPKRSFQISGWAFSAKSNRRFVIASDGIWKFFTNQELAEMIAALSVEEAIRAINHESQVRMHARPHMADHRSIIIGDIDHV